MSAKKTEEKRIYVIVPATVDTHKGIVVQPAGRQVAQACHVAAKLRHEASLTTCQFTEETRLPVYKEITTIILQARDSKELGHLIELLSKKRLMWSAFGDKNDEVYGNMRPITGLAVYAKPSQVVGILDYLPLWGA